VQHEQRGIVGGYGEADVVGGESAVAGIGGGSDADLLATPDFFSGIGDPSIERHLTRFNPRLQPASRVLRQRLRQRHVETQAGDLRRQGQHDVAGLRIRVVGDRQVGGRKRRRTHAKRGGDTVWDALGPSVIICIAPGKSTASFFKGDPHATQCANIVR
jgi:hypothetical protein